MNLTIKDLAADIALAGVPFETARNRVSHYASEGLLYGRRSGPRTSPIIYCEADSAMAIILSALSDCGVADVATMRQVIRTAYYNINRCLSGLCEGESWTLVVNVWRDPVEGVIVSVRLVNQDEAAARRMPMGYTPRGAIVVVLDEMLLPVVRRMHPLKGAH